MRIAHIAMFFLPSFGGVEQMVYELAKRQIADGHEVHVFCCNSDKNSRIKKKEEIIEGIHVHRFPYWFRLSFNTFIWPSLLWKFKGKFDIIHSHVSGHAYILFAGILSKSKKSKHIHTTHCPWTDTSFRPAILKPFLFLNDIFFNKFSFKLIDKIIAITPWELKILNKYSEKEKIKIIPNGVDKILYKKIKNNQFKKKNKIKEKYLVLFFGRLSPTKGPEILAKTAINISKKRKDIAFVWIGPDEGKAKEVKKLIKNYKNMKYLGPIKGKEKIAEMFQASDVYLMPSYREGLPLTLFEAMASGLPIVASPVNGIPFEMKENENGFFSNYGDLKSLEENIIKIIDNKKLSQEISKNNLKKSKNYSWEDIYKKYMGEYNNLLKTKKIIVASGYFDPLHIGHIEYLKLAKKLGSKLVVIVNNDKQAKLKKGFSFMNEKERMEIVKSLFFVDEVFLSVDKHLSVCESLKKIRPHIFAKGGDRFSSEIPESKVCKELGIEIVDGLGKKIQSSSDLIKNIKNKN